MDGWVESVNSFVIAAAIIDLMVPTQVSIWCPFGGSGTLGWLICVDFDANGSHVSHARLDSIYIYIFYRGWNDIIINVDI